MPLIPVLVDVERAGIRSDGPALTAQSTHVERELATRSAQIFEWPARSSTSTRRTVSRILFEKLQLPSLKRYVTTKTASTAAKCWRNWRSPTTSRA